MIRYLIIDDEPIAHDIIQGYCDVLPNLELVRNCYDAIEAWDYLREHSVDLIFLDLNMPKIKGFEFLRTLTVSPKVIVTTAYKEYALEGYELSIIDYLLKPFGFERFLKAVNKAIALHVAKPISYLEEKGETHNRIFVYSNKKYIQVDINTILYIEAMGNYTKIITSVETIMIREKISSLLLRLNYGDLVQVHKSYAVAKKYINSIEGNRIFIGDSIVVPIGKVYKLSFIQSINLAVSRNN